ncbi:mannonate dehydratase [Virgibacillus sp. 6R]|uniref:mannonate dehydratase n=1 Tax=Metabacillus sp. 22489 TaxID=3453928 RepID=UPI00119CB4CC
MKMVFRWFGNGNDSVSLKHIKQIPGVEGIVWSLHDLPVGCEWPMEKILEVKQEINEHGFHIDVVESVNVHEDIKLGLPTRDEYIENYKRTIEKLASVGVKVICYNFMPVFDWTRTELFKEMSDGSTALFYENQMVENMDPSELVAKVANNPDFTMPGWEPERLSHLEKLFAAYRNVTTEDLWNNLHYFLKEIIPVAERHDVKMAIHPDDPPWPIFGLPRIITSAANIRRLLHLIDSPSNCVTLCSGSLGAAANNNIVEMIKEFGERIPFAHIRNVKRFENGDFIETSHRTKDGSVDITGIVKAYHDINYTGYARPDHGRHIFDEECRPGYGLYDRALGIMYIWGLWDYLEKEKKQEESKLKSTILPNL